MVSDDERNGGHGDVPIRDAACLILIDRQAHGARMLMGRRRATQVFLPNKWVFPGGRVDDDDRLLAEAGLHSSPPRHGNRQAFALAAVRETFEETGIHIAAGGLQAEDTSPEGSWPPSGWQAFARLGAAPDTSALIPVARAITPPGRPRRFDTWFFATDWRADRRPAADPDGELLDLGWFTVDEALALDLPIITRLIVDDVARLIGAATGIVSGPDGRLIPFYYQDGGRYRRDMIEI